MKILHLTFNLPYPPMRGAQIRDHALISRAQRDHEVTLVALCEDAVPPEDLAAMREICPDTVAIPRPRESLPQRMARTARLLASGLPAATTDYVFPEVETALRTRLATGSYDILQIEHSLLAPYLRTTDVAPGTRTILSLHNVGALQYRRMAVIEEGLRGKMLGHAKAVLMRRWEGRWCSRADHVVTVSGPDTEALRALGVTAPVTEVPNGIDQPPDPLPEAEGKRLLFVGNLRYPPNRDAVRFLAGKVMPLLRRADPEITLTVAGFDPPADLLAGLDRTGIEIVANAPDLGPLYHDAVLTLAPLRAGGGTRIKILEALALGRAVVATAIAAEGLDLTHRETVLFAESAEAFAEATQEALRDQALRGRLVRNGRALIAQRYDWDVVYRRLAGVYDSLT